jgi:hypothetical protein
MKASHPRWFQLPLHSNSSNQWGVCAVLTFACSRDCRLGLVENLGIDNKALPRRIDFLDHPHRFNPSQFRQGSQVVQGMGDCLACMCSALGSRVCPHPLSCFRDG